MQGQRSWPMLAVGDSARKDRLRMLMFSSFEVVYKVSALRSEFQENWRKILLPEAYLCINHSFGIFFSVSPYLLFPFLAQNFLKVPTTITGLSSGASLSKMSRSDCGQA